VVVVVMKRNCFLMWMGFERGKKWSAPHHLTPQWIREVEALFKDEVE
jgi:hypothetical protein